MGAQMMAEWFSCDFWSRAKKDFWSTIFRAKREKINCDHKRRKRRQIATKRKASTTKILYQEKY